MVSYLELLFDLAFIFALMQVSGLLTRDLRLEVAARTALLLGALWAVWITTAWSANWYNMEGLIPRWFLLWVMLGGLILAAAAPTAYGRHALVFAGAYVAIHIGRDVRFVSVLHGPGRTRSARILISFLATGVLWITGAVIPAVRLPLWATALSIDYLMVFLRWPVPVLGRTPWQDMRVHGRHVSLRYQQIFIIALGELVLDSGSAYVDTGLGLLSTIVFVLTFLNVALLARVYFLPHEGHLGELIDNSTVPARLGLDVGLLHLVIVTGVLSTAVGAELAIAHASGPARGFVVMTVVGTLLFLAGRNWIAFLTDHRPPLRGMTAMAVIAVLTPALLHLPTPLAMSAADAVLAFTAVSYYIARRGTRRRPGVQPD